MTDGTVFALGIVVNQDPEHGGLVVAFRSGQIPALPVRMLYHGYADPLRIKQQPLPQKGTAGLVCFPGGDPRNGLWIGSYFPNLQDAITSDPGDPSVDYYAHWSGFWSVLDASGTLAAQWPDGSYFVAGSGISLPVTYRHIVDQNQQQQRAEYAFSERVANPPSPFAFTFSQASGITATVDASGNTTIIGPASGANATLTLKFGGTTIVADASGNISLNVGSGKNLNITDGGSAGDGLALVSLLLNWLNSHVHTGVMSGGSNTGTPASPATAEGIESAIIKIQQ